MAIDDLDCPNCGAPVDFAGGTRATCSFCKSQLLLTGEGVRAASTLNDLLEQSSIRHSVDVDAINDLLRQGKKIEAIRLYRQQTGVGLKEAKDAVETIERTGTPPPAASGQTITGAGYRSPRTHRSTLGCLFGCLPILLFIGLCAGFIMLSSQVMFRAFGPLGQALQIINTDPAVVRALGEPVAPGAFITGSIGSSGSSSSARFSVPIFGSRRSGELRVSGNWRNRIWDLNIWVVYDDAGEEQTIYITQKVK
jgi:hypothetical protein